MLIAPNFSSAVTVGSPREDSQYFSLSDVKLQDILEDKRHLVEPQFKVPVKLQELVGFWTRIYVQYSSLQVIAYDREYPSVIYEVIDFRDLYQRGLNPVALEINSKRRIQKLREGISLAFNRLANTPAKKLKNLTGLSAQIFSQWQDHHPEMLLNSRKNWAAIRERVRFQWGQRDRVIHALRESNDFQLLMESLFSENGLPPQLARLCLLESSFVIKAQSKADAVGVWQFLKSSAREFMRVDQNPNGVDERLSPIKSTVAAIKFLKRNLRMLHDLPLAIISYNHGIKGLLKVKSELKGGSVVDLLNGKLTAHSPLGFASRNYYAEFLAMVHAEAYRNFVFSLQSPPTKFHSVSVISLLKNTSIFQIAADEKLSLNELQAFNPDIFQMDIPLTAGTRVVIPHRENPYLKPAPRNVSIPGIGALTSPLSGVKGSRPTFGSG